MNIQRKNSAHHFRMQSEREQTLVNEKGDVGMVKSFSKTYGKGEELSTTCILNKSYVKMPVRA